jgi:type II secretory pathway predicted ATPase ExeA
VSLIGEVGTGKTTLLNLTLKLLQEQHIKSAFIVNSRIDCSQLLEYILAEFNIDSDSRSKVQQLVKLNQWLLERYEAGESALLIVDEAQNLSLPVLEEIRLLSNLETAEDKLLQVVLSGQPELEEKLNLPELRQLRQRISVQCKTFPLTKEQTHEYIAERLRIAGARGQKIFTAKAVDRVHAYAHGIPRLINMLCENALIHGYVEGQSLIGHPIIEKLAQEFRLKEKEMELVVAMDGSGLTIEVQSWDSFIEDFGDALTDFRMEPIRRKEK